MLVVRSGQIGDVVVCCKFDFAIDDAVISKEPHWKSNVVVYVIYV